MVGTPGFPVYLGSSDIEGFQAAMFVLEVDARADDWLARLTTSDGATLGGFASTAAALAYDYTAPLRWFPGRIAVTETAGADGFPVPDATRSRSRDSELLDQVGLAMGYAEFFALTDRATPMSAARSPRASTSTAIRSPTTTSSPTAKPPLHDRALAMMRVAVINLDRLHIDCEWRLRRSRRVAGHDRHARPHRVDDDSTAYTILGLRTVLRSLGSQLELYSNNTPDTATTGALDGARRSTFPAMPTLDVRRSRAPARARAKPTCSTTTSPTRPAAPTPAGTPPTNDAIDQIDTLDAPHGRDPRPVRRLPRDRRHALSRPRDSRCTRAWTATFYDADARSIAPSRSPRIWSTR